MPDRVTTNDHVDKAGDVPQKTSLARFRGIVWEYWRENGRHDLPWRKTKDPYKILVSEVMLQQTQVPRVIGKYKEFLKAFPSVYVLAHATLADVLKVWSGLGYNKRGKYLHDAAKAIVNGYGGSVKDATAAKKLPGVGPYTKAAVRVFAFNEPHVLLETNVRAAFIHHFFDERYRGRFSVPQRTDLWEMVSDKELMPYIERAAKGQDPREWHWALMDYGVHIKKLHKNPARRSTSHVRQSKFEGSLRQVRGAILKAIHEGKPVQSLPFDKKRRDRALKSLVKDGLISKRGGGGVGTSHKRQSGKVPPCRLR